MRNFKFYIKNFGCKVNQYDGQVLGESLSLLGERVSGPSGADIVVVNTCGVTKPAVAGARRYVRRIKKNHPAKEVLAVGCAAGKSKKEFTSAGAEIAPHFKSFIHPGRKLNRFRGHTRGFLKIQQGCRGSCSYCSVRDLKKPFYVKPPEEVIREMRIMSQRHGEIVLCGTNLEFYRSRKDEALLGEVIKRVKKMPPDFRWRFSSIPPGCLVDENLKILKEDEKFCPHFHIPVQSASEEILQKMKRPYSIELLENRIEKVNNTFKEPAFSYDIMVGFPSETDGDFERTVSFLKKYPPVRVHVFRYSRVRDTQFRAAGVKEKIKRRRMEEVKEISAELIRRRMKKEVGKIRKVIVEKNLCGYTRQYLPVKLTQNPPVSGETEVLITGVSEEKLVGSLEKTAAFEKIPKMCY